LEKCIKVQDRDTVLEISYEDMIKYHGRLNIGGVALAYQSLKLGLSKLLPEGDIPERHKISFNSALGDSATGVVDGVEMATRARSRGCLSADMDCGREVAAPANPDGGKFYFEVIYDGVKIGLALKQGLILQEFTDLLGIAMERGLNINEMQRLQEVKEQIAAVVMAAEAKDLFDLYEY
jgi:hypothetical protein